MNPGEPRRNRILNVLMAVCVAGILVSAYILFTDSREYAQGDAVYEQLRLIGESSADQADTALPTIDAASSEEKQPDFASLEKINPDVVGWLAGKGTGIDYPVVRGKDNFFYLHHLFTGERNKLGSIFMDYRSQGDFSDENTIIYGHNMKDGSMFSSLTKYNDQRYYDEYPAMFLHTPAHSFTIEWFAGLVVDGDYESIRFDFKDDDDFRSYIDSLKKASTFESNAVVEAGDQIITLCTCSYEFNNARYALYGKLTPVSMD